MAKSKKPAATLKSKSTATPNATQPLRPAPLNFDEIPPVPGMPPLPPPVGTEPAKNPPRRSPLVEYLKQEMVDPLVSMRQSEQQSLVSAATAACDLAARTNETTQRVLVDGQAERRTYRAVIDQLKAGQPAKSADAAPTDPAVEAQGRSEPKGNTKRKRGRQAKRDTTRDKRIYEARNMKPKTPYERLARDFFGDETKTRQVGVAINTYAHKLRRQGLK